MKKSKKERYLWALWIFWIITLCSYVFPQSEFFNYCLIVMTCLFALVILFTLTKRMDPSMFNFNKKETDSPVNATAPTAKPQEVKIAAEPGDDEVSGKETTISSGSKLTGEIVNESNISINGQIVGDIVSKKTVQICKEGKVSGKVSSLKVLVNGLLKGCCNAKSVTILSRGRIEGDVYAEEFSIEKGGVFIGNSHVVEEKITPGDKDALKMRARQEMSEVITPKTDVAANTDRTEKVTK